MLRARTVDEFDAAMRDWVDPGNNLLMADRRGAIGYLMRGRVPIRPRANGWLPVPGWTGEHEWDGAIPFEALPRARDPQTGYLATANNRIVADDYPHYIALDWAPPHRAGRITARLEALSGATVADMAAIHAERVSLPSRTFTARLARIAPADGRVAEARRILQGWDGTMAPDLVAPTIYAVWREQTTAVLVERGPLQALRSIPLAQEPVPLRLLSLGSRLRAPVAALLAADDQSLLPAGVGWDEILAEALARAVAWLTDRLGPAMESWTWGSLHRTAPRHTLAGLFPELAGLLNPPAVGAGGDGDTPQVGAYAGLEGVGFALTNTSVARYCFDLADWDNSGWVVPLGASGHPGSPHYADQVAAWRDVRLLPMIYSWDRIAREAESRQSLEPTS
jgi:penicillin G amidase